MAFKFIALFAIFAVTAAGPLDYQQEYQHAAAPVLVKNVAVPTYVKQQEYEVPAKYEFNYAVNDEHTGDIKNQQEVRDGDNVHGSYSLIDADGFKRTVEYTADEYNGFQATVHREPIQGYNAPVVPVQKYVAAGPIAPVAQYVDAPTKVVASPIVAKYDESSAAYYNNDASEYNYQH